MEVHEEAKEPALIPRVIYQRVNVDFQFDKESMACTTTMLMTFPRAELSEGSEFCLHCRVPVENVLINNMPAEFDLRDPLRCIHYDETRRDNYVGKEADVNFRSALEISTQGELLLKIPDGFETNKRSIDPLPLIPENSNASLSAIFDTLDRIITASLDEENQEDDKGMDEDGKKKNYEESEGLMNVEQEELEKGFSADNVIVQVTLSYKLKADDKGRSKGYVYRRNIGDYGPSKERGDVSCVYTTGAGGDGVITDYDGVRCWLPCVDTPDQRAVYDITINAPSDLTVISCGKQIRTEENDRESMDRGVETTPRRFITSYRLPAYSVGFFVGRTEEYRLPLFRISGRSHVALGLSDTVASSSYEQQKALKASVEGGDFSAVNSVPTSENTGFSAGASYAALSDVKVENLLVDLGINSGSGNAVTAGAGGVEGATMPTTGRRRSVSFSAPSGGDIDGDSERLSGGEPSKKRVRLDPPGAQDSMEDGGSTFPAGPTSALKSPFYASSSSSAATGERQKRSSLGVASRNLYEEVVRHSNLGLDLSVKLVHKFVGRGYGTALSTYQQVFVRDLGAHFLSFDGFSLVDASVLHSRDQVFAETSSHLTLLRAYLYSWLMSALPLDSRDLGFLLHGVVGYLQNVFVMEVFGPEEGPYRVQKCADTTMELEKRGLGCSLWQSYPESSVCLQAAQRQYVANKSTVLFHCLESRLGGEMDMRKALLNLVRGVKIHHALGKNGSGSPRPGASGSSRRGGGSEDDAWTPRGTARTPNFETPDSVRKPAAGYPFHPEEFLDVKGLNDCISLHSLFKTLQDSAKGSLEAPDAFIAQYLRNAGALLLNVGANVDPAADGTVRNCFINVSSHLTRPDEVSSVFPLDFKLRVVETRDDLTVEEIMPLTGKPETLKHEIAVKMRSNRGRRPMDPEKKAKKAKDKLSEQQVARREQIDAMIVANKDSVDLARDVNCPVKMIMPDPMCTFLYEAQLNLPECMLVEVLYADQDNFDVYRQVQALRSIARVGAGRDDSGALVGKKASAAATRLHLTAMVDCITRRVTNTEGKDARFIRGHWDYVIAEASFALASWQNLRAPVRAHQWETVATLDDVKFNGVTLDENPWLGLAALITCIRRQFMVESVSEVRPSSAFPSATAKMRQKFVPANIDLTNPTRLISLLMAIAKVRSRNGTTPHDVTELLVAFAAHGDDREPHTTLNKFSARMDTSHYKALLLFALSQVRVEPFKGDSRGVLGEISSIANTYIRKQFRSTVMNDTRRRGIAELDEERAADKTVLVAMFDHQGLVTAAALGCLVEGDMQILQGDFTTFQESLDQHLNTSLSLQPLVAGASGVEYLKYVLPPGAVVGENAVAAYGGRFEPLRPSGRESRAATDAEVFHITTPCVRATALEAFLRLCFMQHLLYNAKFKLVEGALKKHGVESSVPITHPSSAPFLPVAIQTAMLVIAADECREVRRAAAQSLRGAIEGRPPRMVAKYLSQAEPLNCFGWADPEAFAMDLERSYHRELRVGARSLEGPYAAEALKLFWKTIVDCHYDQQIRSELLAAWLYLFPKKGDVPAALVSLSSSSSSEASATHEELTRLAGIPDEIPPTIFEKFDTATNRLCGIKNADKPPPPLSIGLPSQPRLSMGVGRKATGAPSAFGKASGISSSSSSSGTRSLSGSSSSGGGIAGVPVAPAGPGMPVPAVMSVPSTAPLPAPSAQPTAPLQAAPKPAKAPALRLSLGSKKSSSSNLSQPALAGAAAAGSGAGTEKKAPLARKLSLTLKKSSSS